MKKEQDWKEKERKTILKKRTDIRCDCKSQKSNEKDRVKYGTCNCDTFSLCHTLPLVIANSLYQFIAKAKPSIVEPEEFWLELEKNADAIKAYSEYDGLTEAVGNRKDKAEQKKIRIEFERAMKWLTKNFGALWW